MHCSRAAIKIELRKKEFIPSGMRRPDAV